MNTDKKKASSFPAGTFTNEDIKAMRDYRDKLEALTQEAPEGVLTPEEWDEAMQEIERTGKIPAKYAGRIGENEIEVRDGMARMLDDNGEPILDDEGKPRYKHVVYDTPQKRKAYYDIADEAHNAKIAHLEKEYHDSIIKVLKTYYGRHKGENEDQAAGIAEIITELLEDPVIRRELEKEAAAQRTALAPLGSVPNGDSLNFLLRMLAAKNGRTLEKSKTTRDEKLTLQTNGSGAMRYIRKNRGSTITIEVKQADTYLQKTNKTFTKVLLFTLQKMTAQNFPLEVGFPLEDLVELGMYSTTSNAGRAVKDFFAQQSQIILSGSVKKGRKTVKEEGGVLFYHYRLKNGYVTLSVNENFNMEFIAPYFTVFPRFAYALSNNAFTLVRYIFFLARQNTQAIKEKGTFTISLEAVRENLGLPSPEDVNNRKYRQYIIEPIEKAIEEVEEALLKVPEAKEYGFTITPHTEDTSKIEKWLEGYLEIGLNGDFAETFVRIATKAEKDRTQWEKVKAAELAKIAARQEAKEAKEAQEGTTKKRKKK